MDSEVRKGIGEISAIESAETTRSVHKKWRTGSHLLNGRPTSLGPPRVRGPVVLPPRAGFGWGVCRKPGPLIIVDRVLGGDPAGNFASWPRRPNTGGGVLVPNLNGKGFHRSSTSSRFHPLHFHRLQETKAF